MFVQNELDKLLEEYKNLEWKMSFGVQQWMVNKEKYILRWVTYWYEWYEKFPDYQI